MMEGAELTDKITVNGDVRGIPVKSDGHLKIKDANKTRKTSHADLAALMTIKKTIRIMQTADPCTSVEERVHPMIRPTYVESPMAKLLLRAKFT